MPAPKSARAMAAHLLQQADQLRSDAERWQSGAIGEERVEAALAAGDTHTMRVLRDRLLKPGESTSNLDHLVVCVGGVYLVDAENWTGSVNVYNGSLWKHWNTCEGRRSENQNQKLYKIRSMAQAASKTYGRDIRGHQGPLVAVTAGPGLDEAAIGHIAANRLLHGLATL